MEPKWRKSSYSFSNGNCTEVADLPDGRVAVRDSKDPGGPQLVFGHGAWREMVRQVKMDRLPGPAEGQAWDTGLRMRGLYVN